MDLRNRSLKRWRAAQKGGLRLGTMGQSPTEAGTDANIVSRYKELEKLRQRLAATKGAAGAKVRPQQRAVWQRRVRSLYGTLRLLLAQRRTQQQIRGAPALDAKLPSGDAKPVDLRKAILSLAKQVASASSKGPPAKGIKKAAKKPRKKAAKKPRKKAKKRGAPASPASGLDAIISEEEQRPAKEAKLSAQLSREMRELAEARAANEAAEDAKMRRMAHEEKRDEEDEIRMNLENDLAGVNSVILETTTLTVQYNEQTTKFNSEMEMYREKKRIAKETTSEQISLEEVAIGRSEIA